MQFQSVWHYTLPWLISFSLDAKAFLGTIGIAAWCWHTVGNVEYYSFGSDTAYRHFDSTLGFCSVGFMADAPDAA
jgi:hypothetical protein